MPEPATQVKLDPEVESFYKQLLSEGELTDQEKELVQSILAKEKNSRVFKAGIHGNVRFNQEVDKLKKEHKGRMDALEADYTKKTAEIESLKQTLSTTSTSEKEQIKTLLATIKKAEADRLKIIQKAREYNGGDDFLKEIGLDDPSLSYVPPSSTDPKKPDITSTLSEEDLVNKVLSNITDRFNTTVDALSNWPLAFIKMDREYHFLTGKNLNPDEFMEKIKSAPKDRTWYQVYEESYDIPNLRKAKEEERINAVIEQKAQEKFEQYKSQLIMPGGAIKQESEFYKAIDSTRTEEEKKEERALPPVGAGGPEVIAEAVQDWEKRMERRQAAA